MATLGKTFRKYMSFSLTHFIKSRDKRNNYSCPATVVRLKKERKKVLTHDCWDKIINFVIFQKLIHFNEQNLPRSILSYYDFEMNLSVEFYTNNDSRIISYIVEKAIQGLIFSRIIFLFLWEWGFDSVYWYARLYGFETSNIAKVVDFTFDSIKKQSKIVHIQH